ncbi:VirB3 family type IV secretion system protein [Crenobacter sp. SG2305]|uniref:VirB3 family type IV secretion system protein n=1 Tax=Crenobacter oryzisoli TaxID=3056844 RepID=UPI0025AADB3A|nr:VirB3 family type IV secretion system protein [Crenobacter sp. SG2305]MDN0082490.1 VirB3 family type IV secretion system protein [Crenobacter sp. SG2305]
MQYQPRISPLHRSLNEIATIGGVEKRLAILNGTLTAALLFGSKFLPSVLIGVGIHAFFRKFTKHDPLLVKIYMKWIKQGIEYDPWHHVTQKRGARPHGFGRGNLC